MTPYNDDFGINYNNKGQSATDKGQFAPRYAGVEILIGCPKCGDKTPINGPQLNPVCDNCSYEITIQIDFWKSPMITLDSCHNELAAGETSGASYLGSGTRITYGPQVPLCSKCNTPLPVDKIHPGHTGQIECTSCGSTTSTHPPPQWLKEIMPNCRQIYGGEPDSKGPDNAVAPDTPQTAEKPVAMNCPSCGAGLSFTSANDRLVPCQYCGADIYMPDAVWRRLHPVKRSQRWYLKFQGIPQKQIEEERENQRRRQEELDAQNQAIMRAAAAKPETIGSSSFTSHWAFWILIMAGFPALIFLGFRWCKHTTQEKNKAALKRTMDNHDINNKIEGDLHAKGPRVGTWKLTPDRCVSGEREGFFGVYLSTGEKGKWVKVVKEPATGQMMVTVPLHGEGESSDSGVVLRDCKVLEGNIVRTNTRVNRIWMVNGKIKLDCELKHKEGEKGRVWGEVVFQNCH